MKALKQALSMLFNYCNKQDNKTLLQLYYSKLSKYDEETVVLRINNLIESADNNFLPAIGKILEPMVNVESIMERDWGIFRKTMNNHERNRPIPDWVYTIKMHLGWNRCEEIKEDELIWLKKEFEKAYPLVKNKMIDIMHDPREGQYISVDGVVMLMEPGTPVARLKPEVREKIAKGEYQKLIPVNNWTDTPKAIGSEESKAIALLADATSKICKVDLKVDLV